MCLVHRPGIEVLVLDEPSHSLDFLGRDALGDTLAAWPGALGVATHDRALVAAMGATAERRL